MLVVEVEASLQALELKVYKAQAGCHCQETSKIIEFPARFVIELHAPHCFWHSNITLSTHQHCH